MSQVSTFASGWSRESLSFADELDIQLEAEAIIVNHGELRIGSAHQPFSHTATIILHGHWSSPQLPIFGIKLIGLTRGKILMHGTPKTSFVRLAATAMLGSNELTLERLPLNWQVGDRLILTSSTHDANCTMLRNDTCQTEEVEIHAIDDTTLTLGAPLLFNHSVERLVAVDGREILLGCEVVNLQRNIR